MAGQADIAMIGVGVMGSNLALNMAEQGATVALYDVCLLYTSPSPRDRG